MMFQASPVDLASQFSALALKGGTALPDHYNPLQNGHNLVPGKEDAGHALLKLLQSGSSKPASSAAQGQPHQQQGQQQHDAGGQLGLRTAQQSLPELPLSFLNGPSLSRPAAEDLGAGAGNGLFGAPVSSGSGAAQDGVMPQETLPSLFVGNSIWSTSSTDAAGGAGSSLWGGSSIWSSQAEGWAAAQQQQQQPGLTVPQQVAPPQQQAQQQASVAPHPLASQQPLGPHSGSTLAHGSVGPSSRASSAPLVSPRHSLQHQHQQQFGPQHAHPHQQFGHAGPYHLHMPVQQQHNGLHLHQPPHQQIPSSTGLAPYARQQHQQQSQPHPQPYQQQQLGAFPPQHPPPPPAYPPPQNHGQYQPGGLGMGVDSRQHQGHYQHHQQAPPFPGPGHRSVPADLGMPFAQPRGPLPGLAGLRVPPPGPPPPPPALGGHAPKFAPPAGQQGFAPLLDDRLKPPPTAGQATGMATARPGQFVAPPKVMRHQQLKQPPGFPNHYSPKHGASGNRWVEVGDRAPSGRLPRGDLAVLEAKLLALVETLKPTPEEQERQRAAFQRVREVLQQRWPHARVHLFGSVANGLSVRSNNDLDVCLEMEDVADDQGAKGEVATELGEVLREAGMKEVLPLPKARVPVVKFVVPESGTKVDVTVNNILACINTKLLADYAAVDPRLTQLVAVVKHWAKQRAVNDSYRGTLSSYCYVLMCIHLLQTRSPPVLPSLQQMPPTFHRAVGQWECRFFDQVDSLRDFGSDNSEPLAQLVWSFFEYWGWRHDYSADVISVRTGGFLRKEDKDWTRRIGNERHLVCIEDPFELSHDLGRTVDRQTKSVLHKEFIRAATLLRDAPDPMEKLFEPYRVGRA